MYSGDRNNKLVGIQMVQTCPIIEWSFIQVIGYMTDGLNTKLRHGLNNKLLLGIWIQMLAIQIPTVLANGK